MLHHSHHPSRHLPLLPQAKRLVTVVRDPNDVRRDYHIPESRAEALYIAGMLDLCEIDGALEYVSHDGREVR